MIFARRATSATVAWVFVVLLTACAAGGNWTKAGADAATTAANYRDCRATAQDAVRTDADIDQDIAAARQSDLQRSSVVRMQTETMQSTTVRRADTIVAACMQSLGYRQGR